MRIAWKGCAGKRALINIVLDDGTGTIRAVLFHENLSKIGLNELGDVERLISQREDLIGKEMVFSGNVRMNKFLMSLNLLLTMSAKLILRILLRN